MKTLGKLIINAEKVLNSEDLRKLKGGWSGICFINCEGAVMQGYGYGASTQEAANHLADTYSWCDGVMVLCGTPY